MRTLLRRNLSFIAKICNNLSQRKLRLRWGSPTPLVIPALLLDEPLGPHLPQSVGVVDKDPELLDAADGLEQAFPCLRVGRIPVVDQISVASPSASSAEAVQSFTRVCVSTQNTCLRTTNSTKQPAGVSPGGPKTESMLNDGVAKASMVWAVTTR